MRNNCLSGKGLKELKNKKSSEQMFICIEYQKIRAYSRAQVKSSPDKDLGLGRLVGIL